MTMVTSERATSRRTAGPAPLGAELDDDQARSLVVAALHAGAPQIVVQPILGLTSGRAVAYEALSRFTHVGPTLPPDRWFEMAHRVGLGATVEARAVDIALRAGDSRPSGTLLSINVSPSVLSTRELHDVLPFDLTGLQFEITEKEVVEDPSRLTRILGGLRNRGARIAVDDVGEGYAGLQRVMSVSPDLLKLDRSLVTGVEAEAGKRAMIEAVVRYAANVGAEVCAEGVESLEDLYVLADLDVAEAQGWVIGMPSPTFDGATEASRLTCENAFARALSLVERDSAQGGTTALEFLLSQLVATQNLDALARLMTLVATTLRCDHVALSCLDAEGQYLEAIHPESWQLEGVRYYLDDYPASKQSLETLQMLRVDIADPHADDAEVEWMLSEGLESVIGVPIVSTGRPIGLLECSKMRATPWTRLQLRHARIVATVLGPVLSSLQSTWH